MSLIENIKDEEIKRICDLLKEAESKNKSERMETINLLENAVYKYEKLRKDKGKAYCSNNCPDIPKRMNMLINRLMEYNS